MAFLVIIIIIINVCLGWLNNFYGKAVIIAIFLHFVRPAPRALTSLAAAAAVAFRAIILNNASHRAQR